MGWNLLNPTGAFCQGRVTLRLSECSMQEIFSTNIYCNFTQMVNYGNDRRPENSL